MLVSFMPYGEARLPTQSVLLRQLSQSLRTSFKAPYITVLPLAKRASTYVHSHPMTLHLNEYLGNTSYIFACWHANLLACLEE